MNGRYVYLSDVTEVDDRWLRGVNYRGRSVLVRRDLVRADRQHDLLDLFGGAAALSGYHRAGGVRGGGHHDSAGVPPVLHRVRLSVGPNVRKVCATGVT